MEVCNTSTAKLLAQKLGCQVFIRVWHRAAQEKTEDSDRSELGFLDEPLEAHDSIEAPPEIWSSIRSQHMPLIACLDSKRRFTSACQWRHRVSNVCTAGRPRST